MLIAYRMLANRPPGYVSRGFRLGQILSSALLALSHGTNDGQKTMGVITLALVANGSISATHLYVPLWVIASAATAMGLGTYAGGWRIIKTTGTRIINMNSVQGFAAQGAGAAVILAVSQFGFPISTTHVINGGVMGAGAARRFSAVRWGVAGNIAVAWMLTLPAAALCGAIAYAVAHVFGHSAARTDGRTRRRPHHPGHLGGAEHPAPRYRSYDPGGGAMSLALGSIIAGSTLLKLIVGALVAGLGVTVAFSGLIYCVERTVTFRRGGRRAQAALYQAASALSVAVIIAIITYGLILTTSKPK